MKDKDKDKKDEHGGIGTPATRAAILETLKKRNYITLEKGKLIPTDTGYSLIDALPGIAVNPDMTALWSEKQSAIENGDLTVEQFINELYGELTGMISDVDLGNMKIEPAAPAGQFQRLDSPCPSCGKHIVIRPKGYFCTGCEFKIWSEFSGKKITQAQAKRKVVERMIQFLFLRIRKQGSWVFRQGLRSENKAGMAFSVKKMYIKRYS